MTLLKTQNHIPLNATRQQLQQHKRPPPRLSLSFEDIKVENISGADSLDGCLLTLSNWTLMSLSGTPETNVEDFECLSNT